MSAAVAGTAPIINRPMLAMSARARLAMCWTSCAATVPAAGSDRPELVWRYDTVHAAGFAPFVAS
jgi:hypothetical protein